MRALFVARNIPLPDYRENDIILQFAARLIARGAALQTLFPAEFIPLPARWLSGAPAAVARLPWRFEAAGLPIDVLRYPRLPGPHLSYRFCEHWWSRASIEAPDWVHAHYAMPDGWIARQLAGRHARPLLVTVRAGDVRKMQALDGRGVVAGRFQRVLAEADRVFAPSPSIQRALSAWDIESDLLTHGVELPEPIERGVGDRIEVLVAAALLPGKRIDWVVRAVAAMAGDVRLTVVGDGPERARLGALAAPAGERIRFTGAVSREAVFAQMAQADVFALPSESETFGLATLEAAAHGCAVLVCRGTGVFGCFEEGTEMAFCAHAESDFRQALAALCESPERRLAMGRAARQRVARDYQWSAVLDRYEQVLREVGVNV